MRESIGMLAIVGLTLSGICALGFVTHGGAGERAGRSAEIDTAAAEATMTSSSRNSVRSATSSGVAVSFSGKASVTSRAKSGASSGASAQSSVSADGESDCAADAGARVDSNGQQTITHQWRRVRTRRGRCSAEASATARDASPDAEVE